MSKNTQNDIKTLAYVLRRTNYGEADRILNLITPTGKISAIAKSVRKEKSKLAGGIEMFSLVELNIHQGKSEFGIVTSARMLKYYSKILAEYERMELAALILKKVSLAAESSDNPEYFKLVDQGLKGLDLGMNLDLVESWFLLNLTRATGEEINIYRDIDGEKLNPENNYTWDVMESVFIKNMGGDFGANEIKMLRLMLTAELLVVSRVKNYEEMMPKILRVAKSVAKIKQ